MSIYLYLLLGLYCLPSLLALLKWRHNSAAIIALNILLGWTFVGWVISLVWALTSTPSGYSTVVQQISLDLSEPSMQANKPLSPKERVLSNDVYKLFLIKHCNIEKNDVLNQFVMNESLYGSLDSVLQAAQRAYEDELSSTAYCPQCDVLLSPTALSCHKCNAYFGFNSTWKPLVQSPLSVSEEGGIRPPETTPTRGANVKYIQVLAVLAICAAFGYLYFQPTERAFHYSGPSEPIFNAPSFDCSKAKSTGEKLICSDNELASQDNELNELYKIAKLKAINPVEFKSETNNAWKKREATCFDKQCLLFWFAERKAHYRRIIGYPYFSKENQELIEQWFWRVREDSENYWDGDIRKKLNQEGICYGMDGQSRAEYDWHKCNPKSFKDY